MLFLKICLSMLNKSEKSCIFREKIFVSLLSIIILATYIHCTLIKIVYFCLNNYYAVKMRDKHLNNNDNKILLHS